MATIAVVDDDEALRTALASLIRSLGHTAMVYGSAADFLSCGLQPAPACLILDVQMPVMTGPELQDELFSRGHRFPTVFMTAGPTEALRERVLAGKALEVLNKPCHGDLIERWLSKALGTPNADDHPS